MHHPPSCLHSPAPLCTLAHFLQIPLLWGSTHTPVTFLIPTIPWPLCCKIFSPIVWLEACICMKYSRFHNADKSIFSNVFHWRWFPQQRVTMAIASPAPFLECEVGGGTNMLLWLLGGYIWANTILGIYGNMLCKPSISRMEWRGRQIPQNIPRFRFREQLTIK